MVTKDDVFESIYAIGVIAISIIIFEMVVQPVLVFIHPMFIDHDVSVPARGSMKSPPELALLATGVVVLFLSFSIWPLIKTFILDVIDIYSG
jgi:hypothetical protein